MTDLRTGPAPRPAEDRRNAHGDFIWYELITPDAEGAAKFYEPLLGWSVGPAAAEHNGYREIRSGDGHAGGMMQLTDEMRSHGARPTWLGYIGVDDVDAAVSATVDAGGKLLMPAFDIPGVGRIAMAADPQGAPFYLMRGAVDEVSTAFSPDSVGRCAWNELGTSDAGAALRFYTAQFGWKTGDTMPMGPAGNYQLIEHDGRPIGAILPVAATPIPDQPPRWRYYFRVADVDRAVQQIEGGGGRVAMGPHEVPGGDRIVIGIDPQGAEFALVGK